MVAGKQSRPTANLGGLEDPLPADAAKRDAIDLIFHGHLHNEIRSTKSEIRNKSEIPSTNDRNANAGPQVCFEF
jgi:hypothetical protein